MKNNNLAGWFLILLLFACSTPEILLDNNLIENTAFHVVEGRNGWLVNQKLSFGEYQTSKVNRSWTKGYDFPFVVRFSGAKEKLKFSIQDEHGNKAEVFCLGKLKEQDLLLFHQYFDFNLKTDDIFTGSVIVNESDAFDFYITNLNQNNHFKEVNGLIYNKGANISIRPVKNLSNGQKMLATQVPGFDFVIEGQIVGAVETLIKGKVWLKNNLDNNQKLILAGVASALLLRSELADHNDETL